MNKEKLLKMNTEQLREERDKIVNKKLQSGNIDCVNCRDSWGCVDCRDSWGCVGCVDCRDSWGCVDCVNCVDSVNSVNSVNCVDCGGCVDCVNCVDSVNSVNCVGCRDSWGCVGCVDCKNLLFCKGLRNETEGYWICNVEVTKEEFVKKLEELKE